MMNKKCYQASKKFVQLVEKKYANVDLKDMYEHFMNYLIIEIY